MNIFDYEIQILKISSKNKGLMYFYNFLILKDIKGLTQNTYFY